MTSISEKDIGVRCVDISKCLQTITVGTHTYIFSRSDQIGSALRLAANIQGLESITNNQLMLIAARLGIKPTEAIDTIVPLQEELGWIHPYKDNSGKIRRIDENIPSIHDCFKAGGEKFQEMNPDRIEESGIETLEFTSRSPILESDLGSKIDLRDDELTKMIEVGKSANFLDSYDYGTEKIIFSPYLWDIKDINSLKILKSLESNERLKLLELGEQISHIQGCPVSILKQKGIYDDKIVGTSQRGGLLTRTSISIPGKGKNDFLFMPSGKLNISEESTDRNDVFDKVKNLITCMRQGQYFAGVTKIHNPVILLERLLHDGCIGRTPHSEIKEQYTLIEADGIARAEEVRQGRYRLYLNRTKLNEQIIKCGISVLKEPRCKEEMVLENIQDIIGSGGKITVPEQNRAANKKQYEIDPFLKNVMEVIRGERYDLW